MGKQRRIETQEAKELRGARQDFAAPGGLHDKLVSLLGKVLPMGVGVLAALMVITPLSPRGEVSFLLDRNKVAMIDERLRVDNALYRGQDNQSRPFSLTAGEAVQKSSAEGIVRMKDLVARILLPEGPAKIGAEAGTYTLDNEIVAVPGEINLTAADGYRMTARGVSLDLAAKKLVGEGGVEGTVPAGSFSANRLEVDLSQRVVTLEGNAKLRMVPGQLRMP
ncbi:LPS export ABC transporter periplasmic protein LptC [Pontixanthobacter aquaemixtae]|uniref:LPS export ABC transporter periplasmic protein LptC n=1 Tax=Pontixanthobacter aquaemixtae TaxID=1958940 RepID=A0A844ZVT1_9SPHN|nr:LPS export ABC transporter periplasmic protein LptC [Pontixanthobacter aquaemixtae]MXO91574.1 LPS export ABC transporter periplasmic protein LptC [Pontixanthobacter aquaemixtae]